MWLFKGKYFGAAKEYIKRKEKKTTIIMALIFSIVMAIIFTIISITYWGNNIMDLIIILLGLGSIVVVNLILFLCYKRDPKSVIEITNDGFNVREHNRSFSFALYKIEPIEYYDDFIVVGNTCVLQKELLVEGDWEALKSLLKKIEDSLETDEPMYQIEEPTTEFFAARVKSKRIFKSFAGVRMVRSAFEYFATFVLDNGEEIEYQIGQEWYEKIDKEQTGTLVVVNGSFFAFGDGEDVE